MQPLNGSQSSAGWAANQPITLSYATLSQIQQLGVPVPSYRHHSTSEAIVHFGLGSFHRSHLAHYVHRLANEHQVLDWCICGVGTLPSDAVVRDALMAQDLLYTVMERSALGTRAEVVGSISSYLFAPGHSTAVIEKLADPSTRIASLTVTEGGYFWDATTSDLDFRHPAIVEDVRGLCNHSPVPPTTIYGLFFAALARRHKAGHAPFTVMSCDNIVQNGNLVKKMLLSFAYAIDPDLACWIQAEGAFPNSMVDRITPRTTPNDLARLQSDFGYVDQSPVVCEPFTQWVLEDQFIAGRPDWALVGVQLVPDVEPYEKMKVRLLNGGHSALSYLALLDGYEYVHEAATDSQLAAHLRAFMREEVLPLLAVPPGVDLEHYCDTLLDRFRNPCICDQLSRICCDGSVKLPRFIMPSLKEQLARGGGYSRLALTVAAWFRYLTGRNDHGQEFTVKDHMADELVPLAREGGPDPTKLLSLPHLFDTDLQQSVEFRAVLTTHLQSLYKHGARKTLELLDAKDIVGLAISPSV